MFIRWCVAENNPFCSGGAVKTVVVFLTYHRFSHQQYSLSQMKKTVLTSWDICIRIHIYARSNHQHYEDSCVVRIFVTYIYVLWSNNKKNISIHELHLHFKAYTVFLSYVTCTVLLIHKDKFMRKTAFVRWSAHIIFVTQKKTDTPPYNRCMVMYCFSALVVLKTCAYVCTR